MSQTSEVESESHAEKEISHVQLANPCPAMLVATLLVALSLVAASGRRTQVYRQGSRSNTTEVFNALRVQGAPTNQYGLHPDLYEDMRTLVYTYPSQNIYGKMLNYSAEQLYWAARNFDVKGQRALWVVASAFGEAEFETMLAKNFSPTVSVENMLDSAFRTPHIAISRQEEFCDMYCRYAALTENRMEMNPFQKYVKDDVALLVAKYAAERDALAFGTSEPLFQLTAPQFDAWLATTERYFTHTSMLIARWHSHDPQYARLIFSRIQGLPVYGVATAVSTRLRLLLVHALAGECNAAKDAAIAEMMDEVLSGLHSIATDWNVHSEQCMSAAHESAVHACMAFERHVALQVLEHVARLNNGRYTQKIQSVCSIYGGHRQFSGRHPPMNH